MFLALCVCSLCLSLSPLAAAATPLCAFVTVATNSKARQRCSVAVDGKRGGRVRPLTHAQAHMWTNTHTRTPVHTIWHGPTATCIHMSVQEHLQGHRVGEREVGVPSRSVRRGDGGAASILSPHYPHTGKTVKLI